VAQYVPDTIGQGTLLSVPLTGGWPAQAERSTTVAAAKNDPVRVVIASHLIANGVNNRDYNSDAG